MSDKNEQTVAAIVNPDEVVTGEDITNWYDAQKKLEVLKDYELKLRNKIFKGCFKNPREGVNKFPLTEGWILKADHKINRKVDEALLTAMAPKFREVGINPDVLVKWKPELAVSEYRKLTEEEHKLFDQVLEIKEGTPQMEIVLPKR